MDGGASVSNSQSDRYRDGLMRADTIRQWQNEGRMCQVDKGLLGNLFDVILRILAWISRDRRTRGQESAGSFDSLQNVVERLFLWGYAFNVHRGRLDYLLSGSADIQKSVLLVMYQVGTVACFRLLRSNPNAGSSIPSAPTDLKHLLKQASTILFEDSNGLYEDGDALSVGTSEAAAGARAQEDEDDNDDEDDDDYDDEETAMYDLRTYLDCLDDLSLPLEKLSLESTAHIPSVGPSVAEFSHASVAIQIYCLKIRDRFPPLPTYLVERMAASNDFRAARIREKRVAHESAVQKEPGDKPRGSTGLSASSEPSEPLFDDAEPRVTDGTRSTDAMKTTDSIFDQLAPIANEEEDEDRQSLDTFLSCTTAIGSSNSVGARVPRLPSGDEHGMFVCPGCYRQLPCEQFHRRTKWKYVKLS
jgi:hypothetical protein